MYIYVLIDDPNSCSFLCDELLENMPLIYDTPAPAHQILFFTHLKSIGINLLAYLYNVHALNFVWQAVLVNF